MGFLTASNNGNATMNLPSPGPGSRLALIVIVLVMGCGGFCQAQTQPNIIFINTDDWGIGKVPCYQLDDASMKIIKTPNLDRLAARGMRFTRAYAGNAVCGPSRCSLLTGKHGGHAAWRANHGGLPVDQWPPNYPMLGEVARQAGYTTAAFGKLSMGGMHDPETITSTGWDYWLGYLGHVDCRSFYGTTIWENGVEKPIPENARDKIREHVPVLGEHGVFTEDLYTDKIIEFISENREKPFFVYFASTVPHGDAKTVPFQGLWTPSLEGYDELQLTRLEQLYAALMTRHDRNVGRIVEALEELGLTENTIVIWTSDNGDEDSYYGRTKTWDGNGPFRMYKRYLYEGGIRVPMIASWPGTIPAGTTTDLRTTHYDLMPTIADAGGLARTAEMDGISILPTLSNQPEQQEDREYLYWEFYERAKQQAVHLGKWKGYRINGLQGKVELYDLSADIAEEIDVAAEYPKVVERIEQIMLDEHETHPFERWQLPGIDDQENDDESPEDIKTTETDWHGFKKQSFLLDGDPAFVVVPKVAAAGKPWIWRTSFPDFHSEVDRELVRNGFHIGFLNVVAMLGSDASLDKMDRFYDQVRSQWGLAAKPALEPCSRGGLHAYRYAARHPERVACILGDVPVMDLKSWPMKWPGAQQQVQDALHHYGFESQQELMEFTGNPIDLLEPIAKARIPLRHVICLTDEVVPPEENTLEARRRLVALGHDMELSIVEDSEKLHGHHFPYPDVFQSVRFVMQHAYVRPADKEYFELRNGLANCQAAFEANGTGRVAFLGGSITYNGGWRDELMRYLKQRFPNTEFDFIAAGIPSVGSNGHAFRLQRDIFAHGSVDLVFVEAAVNDGSNIPDQPELMLRSMEGVVRHLRLANPMTDIVQMHFAMPEHLAEYDAGKTPPPIEQHERVAEHYGCASLNLTQEVADRISAGQFTWKSGFNNNVHPPPYGQRVYSNSMTRMLDAAFAASSKPRTHSIPAELLDEHSYCQGGFEDLEDAKLVKGFSLDPRWRPVEGNTRAGFVDVPALVASEPGSEFEYTFEGNAFGLFLAAGHDSCVLEYSVDDGPWKSHDTFTKWSKALHLPWPIMLVDGLETGTHRIVVRTTDQVKTRTALHVIHVLVNHPAKPAPK